MVFDCAINCSKCRVRVTSSFPLMSYFSLGHCKFNCDSGFVFSLKLNLFAWALDWKYNELKTLKYMNLDVNMDYIGQTIRD